MAVKRRKKAKRRVLQIYHAVKGGTRRLRREPAAPLPPPTDIAPETMHPGGILRVDSKGYQLPEAFIEAGEAESNNGILPGKVMLTITILAIIFISTMTWFVYQMPNK